MDEPVAEGAVLRPTARILLVDAEDRVLLFRMRPARGGSFWAPPGGGLESGETHEQAAVRELREETGWADPELGPVIGHRRHIVTWHDQVTYDARERWFLARVGALAVDDTGWTDDERFDMADHRWWTVAELHATADALAPRDLATVVTALLRDGPPEQPWSFGL